jgi:type II secretory pathway component PulC
VVGNPPKPERPAGTLFRDELKQAVQAGLGHFLQKLEVRAVTRQNDLGQQVFAGFQILSLRPAESWLRFDFAPGDVVTRIDGVSVEHYDAVLPMFEGLIAKERFAVQIVRGGEEKTIFISIRERDTKSVAGARTEGAQ